MIEATVGKRYSQAIYDLAEESKNVKELYDNLNLVMETYVKDMEFKNFVDHPLVKKEDKKALICKVFGKFDEFTLNILRYLVDKGRLSNIRGIVAEYLKIYYEKNQMVDVEALFAVEPSKVQREKLIKTLEKKTNKKVNLTIKTDKSIIAGGIIKIGDEIIDGSLKRQLEKLTVK
jgi:F-type H+-transporting ATPase subunit delta